MSIDPGAYIIRNVMHGNFAVQSEESTIVVDAQRRRPTVEDGSLNLLYSLWSISQLDNGKYTVRNIETYEYAASPVFATTGKHIITTRDLRQWDIKETGFKGRYVVYTTAANTDLFWGLPDDHLGTSISLRDNPNTPSNQWELEQIGSWKLVNQLRSELASLRYQYKQLQDDHTELDDGVERLNAEIGKASLDAREERERHVQAEAELKASYETASRRERARHLQAEAALKESYEKLLAESVPKTSQRRCICM